MVGLNTARRGGFYLNWARGGVATQSGTYPGGDAAKAIDGNYSGWWTDGSITHTADSPFGEDTWFERRRPQPS